MTNYVFHEYLLINYRDLFPHYYQRERINTGQTTWQTKLLCLAHNTDV